MSRSEMCQLATHITIMKEILNNIDNNYFLCVRFIDSRLLWPDPFAFSSIIIASDGFQVSGSGAEGPGTSSLSSSIT